ncbi:MAG: ion transporter [Candidatus Saccharibacteria bacterium]|nr:ion transporter [Candidatus Saccharibacteria bacterium]
MTRFKYAFPALKMSDFLNKIVASQAFSNFILSVVIVNSVVLGLETSPSMAKSCGTLLSAIDKVCLYIFIVETVMKILTLRLKYFKSGWNIFDFSIVLSSIVSSFPALSSFRILRIIRVFRALKFVSGIRHLQVIVSAIGRSIPSIGWTTVLISIIYYIHAVIGTFLFAESFPDWFGSIGRSMYTLFQVMTLESWSMGISRPIMEVYPYAWIYFVTFVVISSFVMLNFVVGIVVNSICEASSQNESSSKTVSAKTALPAEELECIMCHIKALEEMLKKSR